MARRPLFLVIGCAAFPTLQAFNMAYHPLASSRRGKSYSTAITRLQSQQRGLLGDVVRPYDNSGGETDARLQFSTTRPDWLAELMLAKESQILRFPHELRRFEWTAEDDEAVDEFLMRGKMQDAQAYFEEKKATSVPMYRQTLRYHWTQTETDVHVGVPVPKAVRGANLHLIVAEDAMQVALTDTPSFGVISGKFAGTIDPSTSGWQLVQKPDGSHAISMTLKKQSQPGTHALWYQLLQGEKLGACMLFKGSAGQGRYHWSQDLDYMNVFIPIPEGVRGKSVQMTIDAAGRCMEVSHPQTSENPEVTGRQGEKGERQRIGGELSGLVSPDECSWVIDEDGQGQRCVCLSLRKRRREASESTWWPRCFKEEESVVPPEMQGSLDEGLAQAREERERMERALGAEDGWGEEE